MLTPEQKQCDDAVRSGAMLTAQAETIFGVKPSELAIAQGALVVMKRDQSFVQRYTSGDVKARADMDNVLARINELNPPVRDYDGIGSSAAASLMRKGDRVA